MAALAAEGRAHSFVAYRPFAGLFAGGPLAVVPSDHGTHWWTMPGAFRGPMHGEHVRDTMGKAAGVVDLGVLGVELAAAPFQPSGRSYAVICPDAGAVYKEWPRERWAAVAEFLLPRWQEVFVCGMPGKPPVPMPAGAKHLSCGVAALASLLAGAGVLIGPDSGHLHLADALKVPVLGLYGATSSLTYGPYRDRTPVRRHPCRAHSRRWPLQQRGTSARGYEHRFCRAGADSRISYRSAMKSPVVSSGSVRLRGDLQPMGPSQGGHSHSSFSYGSH
jgi:hypothetical protein